MNFIELDIWVGFVTYDDMNSTFFLHQIWHVYRQTMNFVRFIRINQKVYTGDDVYIFLREWDREHDD